MSSQRGAGEERANFGLTQSEEEEEESVFDSRGALLMHESLRTSGLLINLFLRPDRRTERLQEKVTDPRSWNLDETRGGP